MRINMVHANLVKVKGDAIVNSADRSLLGGCGVDEAVHQAAGPELLEECRALGGCKTGQAKVTGAYGIRCKYIIHTVVPTWRGGFCGERKKLASCYRASLELALEHGCETIAFPLLGTGSRGYPKDRALQIAVETIDAFLSGHDDCEMRVYLVIRNRSDDLIDPKLSEKVAAHLKQYGLRPRLWADAEPAAEQSAHTGRRHSWLPLHRDRAHPKEAHESKPAQTGVPQSAGEDTCLSSRRPEIFPPIGQEPSSPIQQPGASPPLAQEPPVLCQQRSYSQVLPFSLDDMLEQLDEGFSRTLLRLIDEKGMTDPQCYKKANIDRRLFSRIRSDPNYRPSKPTVLAFAVALELTLDETESLLRRAGFALSHAQVFDVIVEFFISQSCFNIFTINEMLLAYDQPLLGG